MSVVTKTNSIVKSFGPISLLFTDDWLERSFFVVIGFSIYSTNDFKKFHLLTGHPLESGYKDGHYTVARLGKITGAITSPINETHIWIADETNHCIRNVDRITHIISTFAGTCEMSGNDDTFVSYALLTAPMGLATRRKKTENVYFHDTGANTIRYLQPNRKLWAVATLHKWFIRGQSLHIDLSGSFLYIVMPYSVARISIKVAPTSEYVFLVGRGSSDGRLQDEASVRQLRDLVFLEDNMFVVTDTESSNLRLVDLKSGTMSTICWSQIQKHIEKNGKINSCRVITPTYLSIGLNKLDIYIVGPRSIYKLKIKGKCFYVCNFGLKIQII